MGRICKKEGFKSGMKERVGDEKLTIISVAVGGINDHIRFCSQMLQPSKWRRQLAKSLQLPPAASADSDQLPSQCPAGRARDIRRLPRSVILADLRRICLMRARISL